MPVADGLALERELLARVGADTETACVRIWSPCDAALVVPARLWHGVRLSETGRGGARLRYPVLPRGSGGDVVPQRAGVVNVAMAMGAGPRTGPRLTIESVYAKVCHRLVRWLGDCGLPAAIGPVPGSFCDGRYNITVRGRKIAGTAQRWRQATGRRPGVLVHAIVLIDPDLKDMVDAVNGFYVACGIDRRCRIDSHTTLAAELLQCKRSGGMTLTDSSALR